MFIDWTSSTGPALSAVFASNTLQELICLYHPSNNGLYLT